MLRSPRTHRSTSESSTDDSPISNRRSRLGMAGVANLFIRVRGVENRIESRQQQQHQPLTKPGQIIITSGEPKTHSSVERVVTPDQPGLPVEFAESYVCAGGVNVVPLLVATRSALQERIEALGADTLTNEQCVSLFSPYSIPNPYLFRWECTITGPKPQPDGIYKVHVCHNLPSPNLANCVFRSDTLQSLRIQRPETLADQSLSNTP